MKLLKRWNIRFFDTPSEANKFYRSLLEEGTKAKLIAGHVGGWAVKFK